MMPMATKKAVTISLTSEKRREGAEAKKDRCADSSASLATSTFPMQQRFFCFCCDKHISNAAEPGSSMQAGGHFMLGKTPKGTWDGEQKGCH